ncbi:DUF2867 domain-containing protein [Herbaspirillum sp. ST 5-3]|uniref:DUF2867 domain-containing protein n=1 Tax=Oxalobacteraceae TaxID=75682 RepID=UPI0010A39BC4|nr:DUF2867 domain-containing protein [Herbaspirillum sp. ST 5-3]
MNNLPRETGVPANSRIAALLPGSYFHDAWCIESSAVHLSALEHFIMAARSTPRWVDACMVLRNRTVALVGLKNLGRMSALQHSKAASDYRPGDRVGIFTIFESTFDEVLLGDHDKHLKVVLSIHRYVLPAGNRVMVTVTTVVHVHNALGRLYMLPVKPMHRLIAPSVLRAIGKAPNAVLT